jgi:hypothetical protein
LSGIRTEGVSGVGRKMRRNGKKGVRLCKEDFIVCCSNSANVMNPLPKYDH